MKLNSLSLSPGGVAKKRNVGRKQGRSARDLAKIYPNSTTAGADKRRVVPRWMRSINRARIFLLRGARVALNEEEFREGKRRGKR